MPQHRPVYEGKVKVPQCRGDTACVMPAGLNGLCAACREMLSPTGVRRETSHARRFSRVKITGPKREAE